MNFYYQVYPAADVAARMAEPTCVTTIPRYTLDETKAILKFTEPFEGCISHPDAILLMSTDAWQAPEEEPS